MTTSIPLLVFTSLAYFTIKQPVCQVKNRNLSKIADSYIIVGDEGFPQIHKARQIPAAFSADCKTYVVDAGEGGQGIDNLINGQLLEKPVVTDSLHKGGAQVYVSDSVLDVHR